jgi:cytochrome bd-type quinol oxidase subunit 2
MNARSANVIPQAPQGGAPLTRPQSAVKRVLTVPNALRGGAILFGLAIAMIAFFLNKKKCDDAATVSKTFGAVYRGMLFVGILVGMVASWSGSKPWVVYGSMALLLALTGATVALVIKPHEANKKSTCTRWIWMQAAIGLIIALIGIAAFF